MSERQPTHRPSCGESSSVRTKEAQCVTCMTVRMVAVAVQHRDEELTSQRSTESKSRNPAKSKRGHDSGFAIESSVNRLLSEPIRHRL